MDEVSPQPPGQTTFTVSGGVGTIRYTLAIVAAASGRIQSAASYLGSIADRVDREAGWLENRTWGLPQYPIAAIDAMHRAGQSCRSAQAALQTLADAARTAAQRYDDAERNNAAILARAKSGQAVSDGLAAWSAGGFMPAVMAAQLFHLWADGRRQGLRDTTEDALTNLPAYAFGLLGPGASLAYQLFGARAPAGLPEGTLAAVGARKALDLAGATTPGSLAIRRVPETEWQLRPQPLPGPSAGTGSAGYGPNGGTIAPTIRGVLSGTSDAYGVAPSSIIIRKVDRGDGTTAWIADVPGTESWWPLDDSDVFDVEGDLEGLTSAQRDMFAQRQVLVEQLLKEALKDAGALPGDAVMLTGHSGGGIHAAAAAADPAFLAEVNVKMLVIAGAPAANQSVGAGIRVLDLENRDDIVPGLDFRPPPDTAQWVTATSTRPGASGPISPVGTIARAHSLDAYLSDADALDRSGESSIVEQKLAISAFLGPAAAGGAVKFQQFVYQGTDVKAPAPVKAERRGEGRDGAKEAK